MGAEVTRQRILDAAIEVIEEHGEAAVRVVDVAGRAGVTQGMVTYHFGTRTNLVVEAQQERFFPALKTDIAVAVEALGSVTDVDASLVVADAMTRALLTAERDRARKVRLNALGYASGDPEVWESWRDTGTMLIDEFTRVFEVLAERGILRADRSPRAVATMTLGYSFGLVMMALDRRPPSADDLAAVINGFVRSNLV